MSTEKTYVGRYCLTKLINTGQSCQLWQAADEQAKKYVAVKRLLPPLRKVPSEIALLKWEYTVGSRLNSPLCVRVLEYGLDQRDNPFLVSDWFPGLSIKAVIKSGLPFLTWRVPDIIPLLVKGLGDIHKQGYIHRDVKPDNFLINANNEVRVIDFAIAQKIGFFANLFSAKGKIQGTRSYMSPEQIRGQKVDVRADIYSLGCTFFEMVTGKPPYAGTADEVLQKQLSAPIPHALEINSNVSKEFNDIIRKMIAKTPEQRFAGMDELGTILEKTKIFVHKPLPPKK